MLKKLLCSLIGVVMFFSMSACMNGADKQNESIADEIESTVDTTTTTPVTTTETTTTTEQPKQLSDDYVLLAAGNTGDDYYELVATETESYNGTEIKIGVIKNNKWSVKLSSNSPFIGEDGLLTLDKSHYATDKGSIYDDPGKFRYIGKGCFYYDGKIINGNNGKSYVAEDSPNDYEVHVLATGDDAKSAATVKSGEDETIINDEGLFLLTNRYDNVIKVLNGNTMAISDTGVRYRDSCNYQIYPYNEGLFCLINLSKSDSNGFYNLEGERIIDLSNYSLAKNYRGVLIKQKVVFSEGACSFKITNDQGTDYMITINKKGEVIDSYEVS